MMKTIKFILKTASANALVIVITTPFTAALGALLWG